MKTLFHYCMARKGSLCVWLITVALLKLPGLVSAAISEPDTVLYGTIVIGNTPVTAARTDVLVEARQTVNGPVLAAYRMGSQPSFGDFYALRLRLESLPPLAEPDAVQAGDSVIIVVSDAAGPRTQGNVVITERGQAQRLNLGGTVTDADNDGLPDAWELFHFGNLNQGAGSINANGQTALANFISGTDPQVVDSGFRLSVQVEDQQQQVTFLALRADGPGYEGRQRFYSLAASTNALPPFTPVANFTNLPGNNQVITFDIPRTNAPLFYRGQVWLQ